MAFDFLTEHDFKGDVNEIEDNMCVLKVNLLLPPQPEIMLSKMMEIFKSLIAITVGKPSAAWMWEKKDNMAMI